MTTALLSAASTLLETLKRLQAENKELSNHIDELAQRKEHLLALKRGLSAPIVSTTQTVDNSPKSNDCQTAGKTPTEEASVPDCVSTESREEKKTPVKAKGISKSRASTPSKSRSSTPSKSAEKRKRSAKKSTKSDQPNTDTQRATPKKSRSPTKASKKASGVDPGVPSASTNPVQSTSVPRTSDPVGMPGSVLDDTATMAATSATHTEVSFSAHSLSLATMPDLPGEKRQPAFSSQTEAAPKKKRRSTSDKAKKGNSRVKKGGNRTASPTVQLTTEHTVSSLLDHSHSLSSFYQPSTFVRPPLLPARTTETSFQPVASLQSRLYYPLVHESVRIGVPQQTTFGTDFGPSRSPDPSGVSSVAYVFEHRFVYCICVLYRFWP